MAEDQPEPSPTAKAILSLKPGDVFVTGISLGVRDAKERIKRLNRAAASEVPVVPVAELSRYLKWRASRNPMGETARVVIDPVAQRWISANLNDEIAVANARLKHKEADNG